MLFRSRQILRAAGPYPVPSPAPPAVLFEETGKRFRRRADLTVDFRLFDEFAYGSVATGDPAPADVLASAPEIRIHPAGITDS